MPVFDEEPKTDRLAWIHDKVDYGLVPEGLLHGMGGEIVLDRLEDNADRDGVANRIGILRNHHITHTLVVYPHDQQKTLEELGLTTGHEGEVE